MSGTEEARERFGSMARRLRKEKEKTLKETARAVGVSAQYLSLVERGETSVLTGERIKALSEFLGLSREEYSALADTAAAAGARDGTIVPQDYAGFALNGFVAEACRLSEETGAGSDEWQPLLDGLRKRKEQMTEESKRDRGRAD